MRLIDFATYLIYTATYIIIIPIMVSLYYIKHLPKELKIVLGGLSVAFVLDILILYFDSKYTFIYVFSAIDVLTNALMISLIVYNKKASKFIIIAAFLIIGLIVFDAMAISGVNNNGFSNAIAKIYVLIISIYYLSMLLQNETSDFKQQPVFWICVGLLSYNFIGLFDALSKPMLSQSQYLYLQFYMVWCIATIFMYGCFTFAFWKTSTSIK